MLFSLFPKTVRVNTFVTIAENFKTQQMGIAGATGFVSWTWPLNKTCGVVIGRMVYGLDWKDIS